MTTPFDGRLLWWHWRPDSVTFNTRTALAAEVRERTPGAAGVVVKVAHGHTWQGPRASNSPLAIINPDDVAAWAASLAGYELDCHIWATQVGADPQTEAMIVAQAANAPGVKSVILDVEPYAGFWRGDVEDVAQYMRTLTASAPDDLHIGMSVDSRTAGKLAQIHFRTWLATERIGSLHPQVYWHDFGLPFGIALHECTDTLAGYGLPIYPVLGTYPNPRTGVAVPPAQLDRRAGRHEAGNGRSEPVPPRRRQLDARYLRRCKQGLGERMNKTPKGINIAVDPKTHRGLRILAGLWDESLARTASRIVTENIERSLAEAMEKEGWGNA